MKKDEPALISIISPVYNVRPYLTACIESVTKQTYPHWELIMVDDGSSDGSAELCDEWAGKDGRIRVFRNQHGGPAIARNTGIEAAKGDYIFFLDSDDWLEHDTLDYMLRMMDEKDADIVCCGVFFDYPTRTKTVAYAKTDQLLSRDEALRWIITGKLPSYLCLMLFKRTVIREPYVNIPCHEDYATGYKWFSHARKVAILTAPKYHYIQRAGSILHSDMRNKYLLDIYQEQSAYIQEHQLMSEADNRANTVRNMLKLAKDFSRKKQIDFEERLTFVVQIRDAIRHYLPVGYRQLGLKRWLRLRLLLASADSFVRIV